ncbi:MAG TPA: CHAT domain-containing tetratricopeptide repeat protein [Ohtaekwangia sp.]
MKTVRLITCVLGLILLNYPAVSQDDWATKLIKATGDAGAESKAKLDSVDFQFAISVNENASIMDVQQKGEGWTNAFYSMKDAKDKTKAEMARDSLETAVSYYEARWYKMAETTFIQAKNMMERDGLKESINYLRALSCIGLVYLSQGRTIEAGQYIDESLTTSLSGPGEKSAAYVSNLNNRAKLDQTLGQYNEAEQKFDQAIQLAKEVYKDNKKPLAIIMNNKAMLYQVVGRYDEGIAIMKEAIVYSEQAPKKGLEGKKSFDSRRFQANLAVLYQLAGKYPEAEKTYAAIKKVFENRGQTNNPEYASLLNQISLLYMQMGKMDQVEPNLKKALEIYKKKTTEESPAYAKAMNDLGTFYRVQGKFPEAEKSLTKASDIRAKVLGVNHPDYIKTRENLGILYWKMGDHPRAYNNFQEAMVASLDFINRYFPPMSEAEKTKYWDVLQPRFQRFYNFCLDAYSTNPALVEEMYDYHMATKALLLSSTNKIKQAILASKDPALIKDYLAWLDKKETLARLYAYSKEELQKQKIDLKTFEQETNQLERSLSQRSGDFSKGYSTEKKSFKQVAALLGETEAMVEIIRVSTFDKDFTGESRYAALVLKKNSTKPQLILFDNGGQLENRYSKYYRNTVQQKIADDYSYDQFWARLDPALQGKKLIYLSVDGVFNQINLNTLKKKDGDYVVNRFDIVILGNSKDLIAIKSKKAVAPKKNALLLGFPDYGTTEIPPLPATKVEIEGITKVLKTGAYQVTQYMQKTATEANLKKVKGPTLVHIATHGYFLKDVESSGGAFGVDAENAGNNPLLRSGIMLAGAGHTVSGSASPNIESNDNGILTAYEAMNLNLEGTDLIVLSACETGLGDVKNGEGVYGLQRAFLVAGADAMIMSLWRVDDAATQQLMNNFYSNWLKLGNKQKAFKQAQLQLMAKYKEPYYWGAFVMMGM